jgi:hypothetical protein
MATYLYETKPLSDIYNKLYQNIGDTTTLKDIAHKAYTVACTFKNTFTKDYITRYLDDALEIDALSPYWLMTSVLEDDGLFSISHRQWLLKLKRVKLQWDWDKTKQDEKLQELLASFNDVQILALSYSSRFNNDTL